MYRLSGLCIVAVGLLSNFLAGPMLRKGEMDDGENGGHY
jgi:hypothetical protein